MVEIKSQLRRDGIREVLIAIVICEYLGRNRRDGPTILLVVQQHERLFFELRRNDRGVLFLVTPGCHHTLVNLEILRDCDVIQLLAEAIAFFVSVVVFLALKRCDD